MKKFWMCLMFALAMMLLASCSGRGWDIDNWNDDAEVSSNKDNEEKESASNKDNKEKESAVNQMIASVGKESVTVEIGKIEQGRFGDTAHVTVQVPNYSELFTAAYAETDPDKALQNAIRKKEYATVEYEGYADVSYDGNEQIVETNELIDKCIEQELIKAINAVMELEEAGE